METKIDSTAFRHMMGCFATGIAVVTAQNAELGFFGLTVNSLTSVSLEPPLVLFCLDKSAHLYTHFQRANTFAVNILAQNQEDISRTFASRQHTSHSKILWEENKNHDQDCPTLRGTLGSMICRTQHLYEGGDHTIFVGQVINLHKREDTKDPLLYFHGRYRALGE